MELGEVYNHTEFKEVIEYFSARQDLESSLESWVEEYSCIIFGGNEGL